jgi:hypothetical protein
MVPDPNRFTGNVDVDLLLNASSDIPAFLYPCQIETRIHKKNLKVRIFPDQFAVSRLEKKLTLNEFKSAKSYHLEEDEEEKLSVWRQLAQDYGVHRASWLIREAEGFNALAEYREEGDKQNPKFGLLPDFFMVTLHIDGKEPIRKWSAVKDELPILGLSKSGALSGDAEWISNFDTAMEKGMAQEFELDSDITNIDKITVVGLNTKSSDSEQLEKLLSDHHYTEGSGFLEYGTPTNNSDESQSGFTRKEIIEERYQQETNIQNDDEDSNAQRLAGALGFGDEGLDLLRRWQNAVEVGDYYTKDLYEALWKVTGDYFLEYFLRGVVTGDDRARLKEHFSSNVRAGGMLPSIRMGNLPYGVLPVTRLNGWLSSKLDSSHLTNNASEQNKWKRFDGGFHIILQKLLREWRQAVENNQLLPRIGDTQSGEAQSDEELVKILAMSASSRNYSLRPFVDDHMIGWSLEQSHKKLFDNIQELLSSGKTEQGIVEWEARWRDLQSELKDLLQRLGASPEAIKRSTLLNTIAWGDAKKLEMPLVYSTTNPNDRPENYIALLDRRGYDAPEKASSTLLYSLLRRALKFDKDYKPWKLIDRDEEETKTKILEFFNDAKHPQEIVDRVVDDPEYQLKKPKKVYGVRLATAKKIFKKRESLEGKRFTKISEIDEVFGVGDDTFRDIIYSFSSRPDLDTQNYEVLLKGVIDLFTHRLDAWISSLANKRLTSMRVENPKGLIVGAYGFVENLKVTNDPQDSLSTGGYVHCPSINQATTAALLKNGYMAHAEEGNNPYRINLSSDRIRRAMRLMQGVREGQELGALLGYQFERSLHDHSDRLDQYKDEFRIAFPIVIQTSADDADQVSLESITARNVVNGLRLIKAINSAEGDIATRLESVLVDSIGDVRAAEIAQEEGVQEATDMLRDTMDAVSDLLIHESVFQVIRDNYERSGAAMDAASGNGIPPELESMSVPLNSNNINHKVCIVFDDKTDNFTDSQPREKAEPRLATWFQKVLGDNSEIGCCVGLSEQLGDEVAPEDKHLVTLDQLEIGPLDFLYICANYPGGGNSELEIKIKQVIKKRIVNLLDMDAPLSIDFGPYDTNKYKPENGDAYEKSFEDAIETAHQILTTLSQAQFLSPEKLAEPERAISISFDLEQDIKPLLARTIDSLENLSNAVDVIDKYVLPLEIIEKVNRTQAAMTKTFNEPDKIKVIPGQYGESVFQSLERIAQSMLDNPEEYIESLHQEVLQIYAGVNNTGSFLNTIERFKEDILRLVDTLFVEYLSGKLRITSPDENGDEQPVYDLNIAQNLDDGADYTSGISSALDYINNQIADHIELLSRYGIPAFLQINPTFSWLKGVVLAASKRIGNAASDFSLYQAAVDAATVDGADIKQLLNKAVEYLIRCMKAVFGKSFIVLPQFTVPDTDSYKSYITKQHETLNNASESRIYLWMQQVAQTHVSVQRLEDMLMVGESWSGENILQPQVLQLPYQTKADGSLSRSIGWQALSNEELGISLVDSESLETREQKVRAVRPKGTVAIAMYSEGDISSERICGLMIDQWSEQLPFETVDTGIALNADTPNQQPPNCCLLAVPGERKPNGKWTPGELEAIVSDTLELAKIRAVDLDALPDLKGLLPAVFLPIQPDQDFVEEEPLLVSFINLPVFTAYPIGGG